MKQSDTGLLAIKWMDKKQVNIISSCSQPTVQEVSRRSKAVGQGRQNVTIPSAVLDYNKNMNGLDLADQYRAYYSVGRSGSKWWRYCFWFLVQTSIVNAFLLYRRANLPRARRNTPEGEHLQFRVQLLRNLLEHSSRQQATNIQQSPSVSGRVAPVEQHKSVRLPGNKKTCYVCSKNKVKTPRGCPVVTVFGCCMCGIHLCKGQCFKDFHTN